MQDGKTAGELANKALQDNTKYDAMEVAYASLHDLGDELYKSAHLYSSRIDQDEYCVVMVRATDPLVHNMKRNKYYCWPWLPSPRPDQMVFLYNKPLNRIIKRLWVLPNALTMAQLATSNLIVNKKYETM